MTHLPVVEGDAMIEFQGDPTDSAFISYIGCSQSTRSHSSQVISKLGYDRFFAHSRNLNAGCDSSHGAAINTDIGLDDFCGV